MNPVLRIVLVMACLLGTNVLVIAGLPQALAAHAIAPDARADWAADGNQNYAEFGVSVSTAGDVNGDGFDDVIVGADLFSHGQGSEGKAFAYLGSASGLSTAPSWTAEGDQDGAYFGHSVATAGDVNGDGFDDVIVGADGFDGGEGKAFAYYGSASGLSTTADWTATSGQLDAAFGGSVGSAGDANGDGYDDVVVGALYWGDDQVSEGAAFVYQGSASGLSTTPSWMADGDQSTAYFGSSVGGAGDVNGDGFDDVVVGAPQYDDGQTDEGRAFVFHGSAAGLSSTPAWTAESNKASAFFGVSVGTAGDVNADGFDDAMVGAYVYAGRGAAFAYHGSASGLSPTPNWTVKSNQEAADFGISVGTGGDFDGDGYADVLVGAHQYDHGQPNEGAAFAYYGSASGLSITPRWSGEGNQANAFFGFALGTAGNVNGDGFDDVIVGAVFYDHGQTNEGRAFAFYGPA
jgi:hypothetical protein